MRLGLLAGVVVLVGCAGNKDDEESVAGCEAYSVTVTVTNPDNEPLTEAIVTAFLSSDPSQEIDCPGSDGVFTCAIPTPGLWKIFGEATSYEPRGQELDLTSDVCAQSLDYMLARESGV